MNNSLYGNMRTRTFSDIFPSSVNFVEEYKECGLADKNMKDKNLIFLFYQLYAAYGNSHISSSDENQFKYKLFAIVSNKGLVWQKSLEVQDKLQGLSEEQIMQAGKYLTSHAFNPGEGGSRVDAGGQEILDYINDQSSTKQSGSYVTAYFAYLDALRDVTSAFISEFKKLFLTIVNPELPLWYVEDEE